MNTVTWYQRMSASVKAFSRPVYFRSHRGSKGLHNAYNDAFLLLFPIHYLNLFFLGIVGKSCYADYHCENGFSCGNKQRCCAPYWGICVGASQCCDPNHVCREEQGFTYRRCLTPKSSEPHIVVNTMIMQLMLILYISFYHWRV